MNTDASASSLTTAKRDDQDHTGPYLILTLLGIGLTLGSFLFLPWIRISPADYLWDSVSPLLRSVAPGALSWVLDRSGYEALSKVIYLLETGGGLTGWQVLLLTLLGVVISAKTYLFLAVVLLLVPAVSLLALFWLPISLFLTAGGCARRAFGIVQAISALVVAVLFLLELPALDILVTWDDLALRWVVVLGKVHVTEIVWFAWIGLLFLAAGGLWETFGISRPRSSMDSTSG